MKKIFILFLIILFICLFIFLGIRKYDNKTVNDKVVVSEVTHSAFYAPWYVAIHNGYFSMNGIDVEVILTSGANNVVASVLSGDADIGLCGVEATIYVYNQNELDYVKSFSGLTKRDGQFIVSRKKIDNFSMNDLIGSEVLAGRVGGMPLLNFINALNNSGIDEDDVDINTSIDFASLTSAFISGVGDYVNLFEPNATKLEQMGFGYVVSSVGTLSGEMPYTAFNARKSFIQNNEDLIKRFVKSINMGLEYVHNHSEADIANVIISEFPDTSINDLEKIIKRYKESDTWLSTSYISEESFKNLEDVMIKSNQLEEYVNFNDLVVNYE